MSKPNKGSNHFALIEPGSETTGDDNKNNDSNNAANNDLMNSDYTTKDIWNECINNNNINEKIYLGNLHRYSEGTGTSGVSDNVHEWVLFLTTSVTDIIAPKTVKQVTYFLHKTFNPNTCLVKTAPYFLKKRGWGQFNVHAKIEFKSNYDRDDIILSYFLMFDNPKKYINIYDKVYGVHISKKIILIPKKDLKLSINIDLKKWSSICKDLGLMDNNKYKKNKSNSFPIYHKNSNNNNNNINVNKNHVTLMGMDMDNNGNNDIIFKNDDNSANEAKIDIDNIETVTLMGNEIGNNKINFIEDSDFILFKRKVNGLMRNKLIKTKHRQLIGNKIITSILNEPKNKRLRDLNYNTILNKFDNINECIKILILCGFTKYDSRLKLLYKNIDTDKLKYIQQNINSINILNDDINSDSISAILDDLDDDEKNDLINAISLSKKPLSIDI